MVKFNNDWDEVLAGEFQKPYYLQLREFLKREYQSFTVYPDMNKIYSAFYTVSYGGVKVVVLGQDPYHGIGQAHGMCFSVQDGVDAPPSLVNIFKEIETDCGTAASSKGNLECWAKQGVLLLNTVLTVRQHTPLSHRDKGWEIFTDTVIGKLNEREKPIIFLLWGSPAKQKARLITNPRHYILQAAHPSPLSAYNGFFGCRHFSQANGILKRLGESEIVW